MILIAFDISGNHSHLAILRAFKEKLSYIHRKMSYFILCIRCFIKSKFFRITLVCIKRISEQIPFKMQERGLVCKAVIPLADYVLLYLDVIFLCRSKKRLIRLVSQRKKPILAVCILFKGERYIYRVAQLHERSHYSHLYRSKTGKSVKYDHAVFDKPRFLKL